MCIIYLFYDFLTIYNGCRLAFSKNTNFAQYSYVTITVSPVACELSFFAWSE